MLTLKRSVLSLSLLPLFLTATLFAQSGKEPLHWYKGNLHTHSYWSDGDDYPEMIVDWYKKNGYQFLAISDHNSIQEGEKWVSATNNFQIATEKYLRRFGSNWVEQKTINGTNAVRLKPFNEYRPLFDEAGKFLLVQAEEVSDRYSNAPVHMGAINLKEVITPRGGNSVVEVMQNNVDAVFEQRERTRQPMFPHINHPNFRWGITAEELMQVQRDKFFEVYNGHPGVHNAGNSIHASTDRIWDIILTMRLAELNLGVVYGLGSDDSHHYHNWKQGGNNPGRGWNMVRATALTPGKLVEAMEAGDFYASSGVKLKDVQRGPDVYSIKIDSEWGVKYVTQFIGTRKNFNTNSEPVKATNGTVLRVTRRYSSDIGEVFAEVSGTSPKYTLKGDEIYVRAKVISSKLKKVPGVKQSEADLKKTKSEEPVEYETAWTQPLVTGVK